MTSQIQKFVFPLTNQETRIVDLDGNPWWVLRDVCEVLSIGNSRDVTGRLDDDEKGVAQIDTPGGLQNLTIVNEAGLIEMSEYTQAKPDGTEVVRVQAKITAKGLAKLASAFEAVSSN